MRPLVTVAEKILTALESGPATDLEISKVLRCTRKLVADIRRHLLVTGQIKQAGIETLRNGATRKLWCLSGKKLKTNKPADTGESALVHRKNDAVSNLLDFVKSYPNAINLLVDKSVLGELKYKLHEVYTTVVNIIPQADKLQDLERRLGPQSIGETEREAKDWCGQTSRRNTLDLADKKALHHNYVVLRKSTYEIAKMAGTYPNKVRRALYLANIDLRGMGVTREKKESAKKATAKKAASTGGKSMYLRRKTLLSTPEYRKIYEFLRDSAGRSVYDVHVNSPELNINQIKNAINRMLAIGLIEKTGSVRASSRGGRAVVLWSSITSKNIADILSMSGTQQQVPEPQPQITEAQTLDILDHEVVFRNPQEMISNESLSPIEG
jgi:hypothetical protein